MKRNRPPRAFDVIALVAVVWFVVRQQWVALVVLLPAIAVALFLVGRTRLRR
jgi:uncharacterized membrane protein YccF (DUF307 family)